MPCMSYNICVVGIIIMFMYKCNVINIMSLYRIDDIPQACSIPGTLYVCRPLLAKKPLKNCKLMLACELECLLCAGISLA